MLLSLATVVYYHLATVVSLAAPPQRLISVAPPFFNISAVSLYDAGRQQGKLAHDRIRGWLSTLEMQALRNFTVGPGREAFEAMKANNSRFAPVLVTELQGIADGAGVGIDEIWGATMINELEILMDDVKERTTGHCSDIYAVGHDGKGFAHGHNEDWPGPINEYFYYVAYRALSAAADFTSCAGLAYPGSLIGWAPSWNAHGMYSTQNSLFPVVNRPWGIASAFAQRQALCPAAAAGSPHLSAQIGMSAMVNALSEAGWASAASLNLIDLRAQRMANVEVHLDSFALSHVLHPAYGTAGNASHFNMLKHLEAGHADLAEPSTIHRQARVDAMPTPHDVEDIKARLSDTADREYPLFRSMTLSTLILNGSTGDLSVWCCGNASNSTAPLYRWNLWHFFGTVVQ